MRTFLRVHLLCCTVSCDPLKYVYKTSWCLSQAGPGTQSWGVLALSIGWQSALARGVGRVQKLNHNVDAEPSTSDVMSLSIPTTYLPDFPNNRRVVPTASPHLAKHALLLVFSLARISKG